MTRQPTACCLCKAYASQVTVFVRNRLDEAAVRVASDAAETFSLSEIVSTAIGTNSTGEICSGVRLAIPKKETRIPLVSGVLGEACVAFLEEYRGVLEEALLQAFAPSGGGLDQGWSDYTMNGGAREAAAIAALVGAACTAGAAGSSAACAAAEGSAAFGATTFMRAADEL